MPVFKFSRTSCARRDQCHPDLIKFADAAISTSPIDFSIVQGYRNKEDQESAYQNGYSKARYGESPHNCSPSLAIDIIPYDKGGVWSWDHPSFPMLVQHLKTIADRLYSDGVIDNRIEWGGDFANFFDAPHWQIRGWKGLKDA